jgi:heme-degrading monooxygenase HmoA
LTTQPIFQSIWEYEVREKFRPDFVRAYDSNGTWIKLFSRCPGYLNTELKRDVENANRFVTVDSWESFSAFSSMKQSIGSEYTKLDNKCEVFTQSENHIGFFFNE